MSKYTYESNLSWYSNTLSIINCCKCGIAYAVPVNWKKTKQEDHSEFCCPNGHKQYYPGETEAEKLKKQLAQEKTRSAMYLRQAARNERRVSAQKGVTTKLKKRIKNGVCPCCNRSFINLMRHMSTQHPEFSTKDLHDQTQS